MNMCSKKLVKVSERQFSINLANGIFMSKLLYGIQIWGLAAKYLLQKVQVLQNKAARITQGYSSYKLDTVTLLKHMNWLSVNQLVILHVSILVHNIIHTGEPAYFYDRIVRIQNSCTRTNMGKKLGQKPSDIGNSVFTRDQFCSKSFDIYNQLPSQITSIIEKNKFKKYLKQFLYDNNDLPDPNLYPVFGLNSGL